MTNSAAIGSNGAQQMEDGEVFSPTKELLPVGQPYQWQPGKFHNLESSKFIVDPARRRRTRLRVRPASRMGDQPGGSRVIQRSQSRSFHGAQYRLLAVQLILADRLHCFRRCGDRAVEAGKVLHCLGVIRFGRERV